MRKFSENSSKQPLLDALTEAGAITTSSGRIHCPFHDDQSASGSIYPASKKDGSPIYRFRCHACGFSGDVYDVRKKAGLSTLPSTLKKADSKSTNFASYEYPNQKGEIRFRKKRFPDKTFAWQHLTQNCRWKNGLNQQRPTALYNLPYICNAPPEELVYIVEGEKDCESLIKWGLTATTNPDGAGHWGRVSDKARIYLLNRHIVILPDNDDAGRNHALEIGCSLLGFAASIKIVEIPSLPDKGDVTDFVESGGNLSAFLDIICKSPPWKPIPLWPGIPRLNRVIHALASGAKSRSQLHAIFHNNLSKSTLDEILSDLESHGEVTSCKIKSKTCPTTFWMLTPQAIQPLYQSNPNLIQFHDIQEQAQTQNASMHDVAVES